MVFLVIDGITHWPRILNLYKKTLLSETTSVPGLLKGAEINFSAYAPVEIAKAPQGSIGLCSFRNRSLFWGLNGMKGQIIQREAVMSDIELSLNIFCEWLQTRKHGKNERAWTQNNQRHEGT